MAIVKFNISHNIPPDFPRDDIIIQRLDSFLTFAEKELYKSLRETISRYLRFTRKHGWMYSYTGRLASSFRTTNRKIDRSLLRGRLEITSNHPAARILHTGGVIRPKTTRFLTVPLSSASQYGFSLELQKQLIRSGKLVRIGNMLYVNIVGAKIPIAVLKASVRIPPYMYLSRVLNRLRRSLR